MGKEAYELNYHSRDNCCIKMKDNITILQYRNCSYHGDPMVLLLLQYKSSHDKDEYLS